MKITAMKITPSHKLTQQVKHPATTWSDLIIPFSPRGQRIWSTSVFFKCVSSPSYATSRDKEKRMKSQTCWTNGPRPNLLFFFFFLFPLTPPRGTRRTLPTQRPICPRPIFHFPFTLPRGTEQKSPTYCPISLRPIFLYYTTSWYILFLFSLIIFFFLHHFVAQSRSPRHTGQNGPRPTFVFFFFPFLTPPRGTFSFFLTPPRSTEQTFSTHC